jgi:hypothetical protein
MEMRTVQIKENCTYHKKFGGRAPDAAAQKACSVHSGPSKKKRIPLFPLLVYRAPGGLRQDPGRAVESLHKGEAVNV